MPSTIPKSVCVFCGSREGVDPMYMREADQFGRGIASEGWRLVYGAGDVGMMGRVAASAQDAGADVFGVIPQHLVDHEVGKTNIRSYVITENMHERKKVMFANSDAIVALPGGPGTLDELFEVLTWRQLGLHSKPIFLLNTAGYWDPLIALFDTIISRGFAEETFLSFMTVYDRSEDVLSALRATLSEPRDETGTS